MNQLRFNPMAAPGAPMLTVRPRASVAQRVYTAPQRNDHPTAHAVAPVAAPALLAPSLVLPS